MLRSGYKNSRVEEMKALETSDTMVICLCTFGVLGSMCATFAVFSYI